MLVHRSNVNTTKIISARRKQRFFDLMGHEIPTYDQEAMADIAQGRKIVSYHEDKTEEPTTREKRRYGNRKRR